MTLLDRLIPEPRLVQIDHVDVAEKAAVVWQIVRHTELGNSLLARGLFALRTLPARLTGEPADAPTLTPALDLDSIDAQDKPGFHILAESPGAEVALGAIGRVWELKIPFANVRDAAAFASFREPGWVRIAWAIRVSPRGERATRVEMELRVDATDAASWRRFNRYWTVIGPASHLIRRSVLTGLSRDLGALHERDIRAVLDGAIGAAGAAFNLLTPFLRDYRNHWGLDLDTANRSYPGDDLVPAPRWGYTHGVEIEAPPEAVWPWVAQIGADRGGFYSYQWLENLAGCELSNADAVHTEWQVKLGDGLLLHPDLKPLPVVAIEPGRWFVAYGAPESTDGPWVAASWLFYVEPLQGGRSRFISRFRCASSDDLATRLRYGPYFTEAIAFVMDRRMLLGVKERVERAQAGLDPPGRKRVARA